MSTQDNMADTKAPKQIIIRSQGKNGKAQDFPRLEVEPGQVFYCRSEDASDRVKNNDLRNHDAYTALFDALIGAWENGEAELSAIASTGKSVKLGGSFRKITGESGEFIQIKALKVSGASGKTFNVAVEDIDVITGVYKTWVEGERAQRQLEERAGDLDREYNYLLKGNWSASTIPGRRKELEAAEKALPEIDERIAAKRELIARTEQEITALIDSKPEKVQAIAEARAKVTEVEQEADELFAEIVDFFVEHPDRAQSHNWYDYIREQVTEALVAAGHPAPQFTA